MATIRAEILKSTNKIRVRDLTDYSSYPNARGVLVITDPNGNYIRNNADFDNPDITVDGTQLSAEYDLNLVSSAIPTGVYTINYSVDYDLDDTADDTKELTFTYATSDLITASLEVTSSVADATIQSVDNTNYGTATLTARTHTLTDPDGGVNTETSLTEDAISLTSLIQGEYSASLSSTITIPVSTTYYIYDVITDSEMHDVWGSDGITDLESSIVTLFDRYQSALSGQSSRDIESLENVVTQVNTAYNLYKINRDAGDRDGAATYLNKIKDLLQAEDITILPATATPIPVTRIYNGYAAVWRNDSGVPSNDLGNDGDYYLNDTNGDYYKKSSGTYSKEGNLGTYIAFASSGTVAVPTDFNGNNADYTNATSIILVFKGGLDDTSNWSFVKDSVSNADGTITDNILTITSITADTGYIDIICSKSGIDDISTRVYVKKIKAGQAVVNSTSIDDVTIGLNGSNKLYVKDSGIDTTQIANDAVDKDKVAADVAGSGLGQNVDGSLEVNVDDSTIEISTDTLQIKDDGVTGDKLAPAVAGDGLVQDGSGNLDVNVDDSTIEISTDTLQIKDDGVTGDKLAPSVAGGGLTQDVSGNLQVNVDDSTIEISADVVQVKDGGITESKILDNNVTSEKLEDDLIFGTFPLTPSSAPDADYEVANKKYVDDTKVSVTGSLHGTYTDNEAFDTLDSIIPNVNDEILMTGAIEGAAVEYIVSRAKRTSSTEITLYVLSINGAVSTYVFTDGGSTSRNMSLAW